MEIQGDDELGGGSLTQPKGFFIELSLVCVAFKTLQILNRSGGVFFFFFSGCRKSSD